MRGQTEYLLAVSVLLALGWLLVAGLLKTWEVLALLIGGLCR